jgi:hypothetical protein
MGSAVQINSVSEDSAKEYVMLRIFLDDAMRFYRNPKNIQAFEAWRKNKEEKTNAATYINS